MKYNAFGCWLPPDTWSMADEFTGPRYVITAACEARCHSGTVLVDSESFWDDAVWAHIRAHLDNSFRRAHPEAV